MTGKSRVNALTVAVVVLAVLAVIIILSKKPTTTIVDNAIPESLPNVGTAASYMAARKNNTLEQRPGTYYINQISKFEREPPAYEIRLLCKPSCERHGLVPLFGRVAKDFLDDPVKAESRVAFVKEIVDEDVPGSFPKIVKIRRSGQIIEYTGFPGYGPLQDFVLDEGRLW